ncbi:MULTISPECIES: hypothetical protein [Pseudomonadaceae]|uniref:Uncharacterized protein n=1 Tax=Ectopseudomonas oleovorans (strain CECT 5344) TaxID=1182590 RepID=W6R0X9_ECTO5|nr:MULTISPECIES: hypothetical protein [Pseudomonas]CDR92981.1 hypothetical protein PPSAL_3757 [Pseudomonas oleovorans]EKU1957810.1 hypothetical protein [Pseudomonas aeruginosa]EMB2852114.1 hypothetical protein [Pseudomonas aeruginosa]MDM9653450.1 hypothetical protein [Pseudomonas wenzhouensis]MDS9696844.1 hypothetical protein [Pseudomonas aeruginosa]
MTQEKPGTQDPIAKIEEFISEMNRERDALTAKIEAEFERRRAEALAQTRGKKNVRGSATQILLPRLDVLRKATIAGTPITQQKEALEAAGVYVSYNSLRKFIQKYLALEYREFLANSRTTGMPLDQGEAPLSELEQAEIDAFLSGKKPVPAPAKEKSTEHLATQTSTRAAPAKSIRKLKEKADAIDYDEFRE